MTPRNRRHCPEERTELWLNCGCWRAGATQPGWGWVHPLPLVLGKQGEKNHGKSTASGHTAHLCAQPQAPTDGTLCAGALCARAAPSPAWSLPLARRLGVGREGSKMPRPELLGVLFVKLTVLEEVDFRRQRRKAALRARGGQSPGDAAARASLRPHSKPIRGAGAGAVRQGGKGDPCREQGRDQLMELGQAWLQTGLSVDCQLWGQSPGEPFPSPITLLLGFSGVSLRVVLAMGQFFIAGISSMPTISTKHLLSQLWLGLASGPQSHEDKGHGSCIGAISRGCAGTLGLGC